MKSRANRSCKKGVQNEVGDVLAQSFHDRSLTANTVSEEDLLPEFKEQEYHPEK
jgi:hypothetical protein